MMTKEVGLSGELHGTLTANFKSPGMDVFSRLNPGEKAMLMSRLADPQALAALKRLATDGKDPASAPSDPMTALFVAIEKHGLEAARAALGE